MARNEYVISSYVMNRIDDVNKPVLARLKAAIAEEDEKVNAVIKEALDSARYTIGWKLDISTDTIKLGRYIDTSRIFALEDEQTIRTVKGAALSDISNEYYDAKNKVHDIAMTELSVNKRLQSVSDIDAMLDERAKAIGAKLEAALDKLLAELEYSEGD